MPKRSAGILMFRRRVKVVAHCHLGLGKLYRCTSQFRACPRESRHGGDDVPRDRHGFLLEGQRFCAPVSSSARLFVRNSVDTAFSNARACHSFELGEGHGELLRHAHPDDHHVFAESVGATLQIVPYDLIDDAVGERSY